MVVMCQKKYHTNHRLHFASCFKRTTKTTSTTTPPQGCIFFHQILFNSPPPVGPFNSPPWSQKLLFSSPSAFFSRCFCVLCLHMYKNTKVFSIVFVLFIMNFIMLPSTLVFHGRIIILLKNLYFYCCFNDFSLIFFLSLPFFLIFPLNFFCPP